MLTVSTQGGPFWRTSNILKQGTMRCPLAGARARDAREAQARGTQARGTQARGYSAGIAKRSKWSTGVYVSLTEKKPDVVQLNRVIEQNFFPPEVMLNDVSMASKMRNGSENTHFARDAQVSYYKIKSGVAAARLYGNWFLQLSRRPER